MNQNAGLHSDMLIHLPLTGSETDAPIACGMMGRPSQAQLRRAFTRLELCACLAGVALLAALALPALANNASRSQTAQCLNNLRLCGRAVQMWGGDSKDQPPWRTFFEDGGTRPSGGAFSPGNAWFEYAFMSNEVVTPRILSCPADMGVKVAAEFSSDGTRGYMSAGFRAQATSYFITLDNPSGVAAWPIFGDRNIRYAGITSCVNGINNADWFNPFVAGNGEWTNAVHGLEGNVVQTDGSVTETTSAQFRAVFRVGLNDNSSLHFLRAR